jgi:hypothetical protein
LNALPIKLDFCQLRLLKKPNSEGLRASKLNKRLVTDYENFKTSSAKSCRLMS